MALSACSPTALIQYSPPSSSFFSSFYIHQANKCSGQLFITSVYAHPKKEKKKERLAHAHDLYLSLLLFFSLTLVFFSFCFLAFLEQTGYRPSWSIDWSCTFNYIADKIAGIQSPVCVLSTWLDRFFAIFSRALMLLLFSESPSSRYVRVRTSSPNHPWGDFSSRLWKMWLAGVGLIQLQGRYFSLNFSRCRVTQKQWRRIATYFTSSKGVGQIFCNNFNTSDGKKLIIITLLFNRLRVFEYCLAWST